MTRRHPIMIVAIIVAGSFAAGRSCALLGMGAIATFVTCGCFGLVMGYMLRKYS